MCKRLVITMLALWITAAAFSLPVSHADSLTSRMAEHLRQHLEAGAIPLPHRATGGGEPVAEVLQWLYAARLYWPAWSTPAGLLPQVDMLLEAIRQAEREGLRSADYFLPTIESKLAPLRQPTVPTAWATPEFLAELDLLLSAAFVSYGTALFLGQLPAPAPADEAVVLRDTAELRSILQEGLDTGQIHDALHKLLPRHTGYGQLRQALADYRRIAAQGGWPFIAPGPALRLGDRDTQIPVLRQRLQITGDLSTAVPTTVDLFDETVEQAVRAFQTRHGLAADGMVGTTTRAALNVSVETRVQQIAVNLDRWRWLPQHLGARYLLVNIPNFTLEVMEQEQIAMTMRVVVGTPQHRTPVFSDTMTHIALSPYWRVPPGIARREILPRLRRDPGYLATQKMKLLRLQGDGVQEVNPRSINWSTVTAQNFHYALRQEPGPANALGRVKFIFPNAFSVYMHDTPQRALFARSVRAFSHGCVRLEQPIALAEYVLRGASYWRRDKILATIARGVERYVELPEAIPVHLVYWTAWVSDTGILHFRPDIYGADALEDVSPTVAQQREANPQG